MSTEPELTEEELRIWIAERCGWTEMGLNMLGLWGYPADKRNIDDFRKVPDYTRDLNAMHEAWLTLTRDERSDFEMELHHLIPVTVRIWTSTCGDLNPEITNATALQRARAFYFATKND